MAKKPKKKAKKVATVEKLTPLQAKRIAIAKDAILQLKAEAYEAMASHGFVDMDSDSYSQLEGAVNASELFTGKKADSLEFNKFMDKLITPQKPCTVCAKGALLLSGIRKYNNCSLQKALDDDLNGIASQEVQKMFGETNADLIEDYFEMSDDSNEDGSQWSDDYPDDKQRLILILENVVKNKGDFKPELLKWK